MSCRTSKCTLDCRLSQDTTAQPPLTHMSSTASWRRRVHACQVDDGGDCPFSGVVIMACTFAQHPECAMHAC